MCAPLLVLGAAILHSAQAAPSPQPLPPAPPLAAPDTAPPPHIHVEFDPLSLGREITRLFYDHCCDSVWARCHRLMQKRMVRIENLSDLRFGLRIQYGEETAVVSETTVPTTKGPMYRRIARFSRLPDRPIVLEITFDPSGDGRIVGFTAVPGKPSDLVPVKAAPPGSPPGAAQPSAK